MSSLDLTWKKANSLVFGGDPDDAPIFFEKTTVLLRKVPEEMHNVLKALGFTRATASAPFILECDTPELEDKLKKLYEIWGVARFFQEAKTLRANPLPPEAEIFICSLSKYEINAVKAQDADKLRYVKYEKPEVKIDKIDWRCFHDGSFETDITDETVAILKLTLKDRHDYWAGLIIGKLEGLGFVETDTSSFSCTKYYISCYSPKELKQVLDKVSVQLEYWLCDIEDYEGCHIFVTNLEYTDIPEELLCEE